MNNRHLILFLFLLIKGSDTKNFVYVISGSDTKKCQNVDKTVKHCPSTANWYHEKILDSCIFLRKTAKSWTDARTYCTDTLKGDLVSALEIQLKKQMKFYFSIGKNSWIGLSDRKTEGKYMFTNGLQLKDRSSTYWAPGEPNGKRRENCIFIGSKGKLADAHCGDRRQSLCQTESQVGPREMKLEVNWHNSAKKLMYVGFEMTVTCSLFTHRNHNTINWLFEDASGKKTITLDAKKIETNFENKMVNETNELGKCGFKNYAFLKLKAKQLHSNFYVACGPFGFYKNKCRSQHKLAFCKRVKIGVSDAVKSRPELTITHPGEPGPAIFNTVIKLTCTVTKGQEQLEIMINKATGPVNAESLLDPTSNTTSIIRSATTLIIYLPFTKNLAKVTFSCFAYAVGTNKSDAICRKENQFCVEYGPLKSTSSKGAKKGPRKTTINFPVHSKPNFVYFGTNINVSCSAISAYNDSLTWKILRRTKNRLDPIPKSVILNSKTNQRQVMAGKESKSNLQIDVTSEINNTKFSCYSDNYKHEKSCDYTRSEFKYCDATNMYIIVVHKPDRPKLVIDYPGFPDAVPAGSVLTASCTGSSKSESQTIKWIIFNYHRDTEMMVVEHDNAIFKSYEKRVEGKGTANAIHHITSTLKIPLKTTMDGMSIGCSAYELYLDNLRRDVCSSSDDLCEKSKPITVTKKVTSSGSGTVWLKGVIIFIGVLMVVLLVTNQVYVHYWKKPQGEDNDSASASDSQTTSRGTATTYGNPTKGSDTKSRSDVSSRASSKKSSGSTKSTKSHKSEAPSAGSRYRPKKSIISFGHSHDDAIHYSATGSDLSSGV